MLTRPSIHPPSITYQCLGRILIFFHLHISRLKSAQILSGNSTAGFFFYALFSATPRNVAIVFSYLCIRKSVFRRASLISGPEAIVQIR